MRKIHEAIVKAGRERADLCLQPGPQMPAPDRTDIRNEFSGIDTTGAAISQNPRSGAQFIECQWKLDASYLFEPRWPRENVNAASEEFRRLASSLHMIRSRMTMGAILISSVLPGEGKTTTSLNLAYSIAQSERPVLLLDGDLRNPRLHSVFGVDNRMGLARYLDGRAEMGAIVQRGPIPNLYFVPSGVATRHPSQLITSARFQEFIEWGKRTFTWLVMDTPPAGIVSDASLMAPHFDGVLLVIQNASTPYDLAQRARDSFPPDRMLGVVLNRGNTKPTYNSYYYQPVDSRRRTTK